MYQVTESVRYLNLINPDQRIIKSMKKEGKPKPSGVSFGNAMFAMKDLEMDYAQFNGGPPPPPQKVQPNPVNKNPLVAVNKKPASISKAPQPASKTLQQKQPASLVPKEQFKIAPGKQYINTVKFMPLNTIASSQNVYELTSAKIASKWEYNIFCAGVPADQIVPQPEVSLNFNCEDLKQGQLGNCYFISALGSVAHLPEILRNRIPLFKKYGPKEKSFQVYLFESGKYIEIIVDNLFPGVYCGPVGNDISPMILEKAYAQVYGNFEVINIGHASDALRDITGAPTIYVDFKDRVEFRNKIKMAFANRHPLVVASKKGNVHPSISAMHSYNILEHQIAKGQIFLKLRDPRGWTKAEFNVPPQVVNNFENGTFWIGQDQLEQNFEVITVCKVFKNYSYQYKTFSQKELTNRTGSIALHPHSPTKVYVSLHQKHKKFFDDKFNYDIIRLLLAEIDTSKQEMRVIKTIKSDFNATQVCTVEAQLQSGKSYMVIAQIGSLKAKDLYPREIFTISVYSEKKDIEFEQATGNIDVKPFLMAYIKENKGEFKESFTEQGLYRYQGPLFGHICLYYENRGMKNIVEELEYTVKNIQIGDRKVQLAPNESKVLIHPIGPENNCSHQCSMKSKTYYK